MFSPNDRWLTKNVKAEEESEKGEGSSTTSSQQTPPPPPPAPSSPPKWSRRDDKDMDEMLGIGDHAPTALERQPSPVHRVTNDKLMSIAGHRQEYFDDEEDVSTLANDTVANETFFKNNRMSPPRQVKNFPDPPNHNNNNAATNNKKNKYGAPRTSPDKTVPETPPKDGNNRNNPAYYKDYEEGNRFSKRFWRVVTVAACLGSFLVAAVVVLGMNYYNMREERIAAAEGSSSQKGAASDNGQEFQFDIRTGSPTEASLEPTGAPTRSPAPTITTAPSYFPTASPSIATPSPTTMERTMSPTETPETTGQPTTTPPTGLPTTIAPTGTASVVPTGLPTTSGPTVTDMEEQTESPTGPEPTLAPTTPSPTEDVPLALIETLINAPNFPLDTMIEIEAKDQSSYAYQVIQWLARDPNLDSYSDQVLVQRFALASVYKGLTKDMAESSSSNPMETTWMTYTDYCEWTVSSETLCNDNGLATSIILENFDLEGELVPEIGLLADSLTRLVLTNNNIGGSLPTELGFLTQLQRLRTHNNNMVGSLPTQLGNMVNMLSLRLGRNQHTGTIPVELGNLMALETIHFPRNQLSGPLPPELASIATLSTINLKDNLLTGQLPEAYAKMPNLQNLELYNNDFTGEIKKKDFCKNLATFIVDCTEVNCKCCKAEINCCLDCDT